MQTAVRTRVGLLILSVVWIMGAGDPPRPDFRRPVDYAAWLNREYAVPDAENAALVYRRAIKAFQEPGELEELLFDALHRQVSEDTWEKLDAWVKRNGEAVRLLDEASRMPRCYFALEPEHGALRDVESHPLRELYPLQKLVAVRARLGLRVQQPEAAAQAAFTIIRVARHLEAQPQFIYSFLATEMYRRHAYELLFEVVAQFRPASALQSVAVQLQVVDAGPPSWDRSLMGERLGFWDSLQRTVEDQNGDGIPERARLPDDMELALPAGTSWSAMVDEVVRHMGIVAQVFRQRDYPAALRILEDQPNPQIAEFSLPGLGALPVRPWDGWKSGACRHFEVVAMYRALRIVLALRAYYADHLRWPAALATALPDPPAELRIDPFSGREFCYRVVGGQPVLYSVGRDGRDDGGRWPRPFDDKPYKRWSDDPGDHIFWPLNADDAGAPPPSSAPASDEVQSPAGA